VLTADALDECRALNKRVQRLLVPSSVHADGDDGMVLQLGADKVGGGTTGGGSGGSSSGGGGGGSGGSGASGMTIAGKAKGPFAGSNVGASSGGGSSGSSGGGQDGAPSKGKEKSVAEVMWLTEEEKGETSSPMTMLGWFVDALTLNPKVRARVL